MVQFTGQILAKKSYKEKKGSIYMVKQEVVTNYQIQDQDSIIKTANIFNKILSYTQQVPGSYITSVIITIALFLLTVFNPEGFINAVKGINTFIFNNFGGFYLWFVYLTLIAFVFVGISPLGKIKLGGKDAKPQHSFFSWFSMLFCAGMGIGLLFWGGAEPLYFFMNPPVEGTNTIAQKELTAFKLSFLHWGLHPWAIYGFTTLAICFFSMNLKKGIFFSSFLSDKLNQDNLISKVIKFIIDNVITLAILFGIVASFGMGVLQFEGGLQSVLGFTRSTSLEVLIIIGVTACYMISTLRGLNKGIKVLSNISMALCFLLLLAILFVLPIGEYFSSLRSSVSAYLLNIHDLSIGNLAFKDKFFLREWTVKYWTWWIAWAPFVGIFTALVSKGRSVRELVFSMLLAPTLFSIVWFSVFGKAALIMQADVGFMGAGVDYENANTLLFKLINSLFTSPFFNLLGLVLVSIFFINSADSATYTLAALTDKSKKLATPPIFMQISWGITFSILTAIFLFIGGLEILQYITLIAVLPFSFLLVVLFIKLIAEMTKYYRKNFGAKI